MGSSFSSAKKHSYAKWGFRQLGKAIPLMLVMAVVLPNASQATSLTNLFGDTPATAVDKKKPLPVNQAFQVIPTQQGNQLTVQINVTDGYYTYKDKLKLLELPEGVTASPFTFNQTPSFIDDPDFGRVPVFEKTVTATATLSSDKPVDNQIATLKWQGCAKAGLCYPPEKIKFNIQKLTVTGVHQQPSDKPPTATVITSKTTTGSSVQPSASQPRVASVTDTSKAMNQPAVTPKDSSVPSTPTINNPAILADTHPSADTFGLAQHTGLALLLLFLAGLGLAFTPCVLPMLPIVANIVARQHNPSAKKGVMLTGAYGLGVATSYGILGAIVAVFGQSLGLMNLLQNPVILLGFALLFILLGLYMLDWLPIRLPMAVSARLQSLGQIGEHRLGSVTGSFITGFFSALVVSPCVSAPLAGAVAGVATVGNPIIGFFALFLLGLGLSTPLILLGATQGNFMPKAGEWMNWVKKGFALMLFAVALLMIERVFISPMMLLLWAIWFAVVAVWAWQWAGKGQLLTKALAVLLGSWMLCLLVGMATGSTDSWQPLKAFGQKNLTTNTPRSQAIVIHCLDELQPLLNQHPNVLVDVTAQWCIECRINDKNLFATPSPLLANWQVVRLDVTDDTANSKAVYQALQIFGPPVLLYYQQGKLTARQNGEVKRGEFEANLQRLNTTAH